MRTMTLDVKEDERYQLTQDAHLQAVESAVRVMRAHLHDFLTLSDIADAACLSPFHFNRVFRRLVGIPPGEYLAALRLQEARHLLLSTPLSVTDICFEVGYNSPGSFTTRFTQLVGFSPRLLRRRAQEFIPPTLDESARQRSRPEQWPLKNTFSGQVSAPPAFQGIINIGLFVRPIPQGAPVCCTRLTGPGTYRLSGVPDGIYYMLAAAFPLNSDPQSYLLPGERMLVHKPEGPLVIINGHISGERNVTLRPQRLTDPPLVMELPLRQRAAL
ncbi:hypothetical protein KDH_74980 [Dictyobacter sp. S3.2.2.5]|uniref:HTH araC/xylS-type domain-containing protein n=1 Tax=Dictyobacter halimunensis TaxID=3026934 RepID=A0ABQ6G2C9_9CHLR|nr:hypothetical protein KDH_74980 [Dictyobacter sp. S3.2.2.5]